jgi:predicted phage tail protein
VFWGEEELSCGYACPSTAVVTCPKGKTTAAIEFDIVFPSGLYGVNQSGAISNSSVAFTFVFTPINDDDEAIGPCFARTQTIQAGTRTPSRHTLGYVVPDGRYKVCVTRQTSISTSTTLVNDAEWYALKSEITTSGQAYGEVTLIAVLMRASDGMASSAQNQISVKCRRILPTVLSDLQTTQATKNPSDAFYDVVTNPVYGANRPAAEADLDHLKTLATGWASKSGWNGVFDSRTTVWEALSAIGFPYHAFPATDGAVISMVEDVARTVPRFAFTEDNIADKSLTISYQFDNAEAIDGIEVLYRSPDDFSEQYALYPANSVFPEQVTAIGLTDETEAEALSQRLWKQRQLRRQFCSFTTELEGHIPLVGELITITHTMLGDDPTLWIAGSIEPQDELTVKIEGHRYVEEIYL